MRMTIRMIHYACVTRWLGERTSGARYQIASGWWRHSVVYNRPPLQNARVRRRRGFPESLLPRSGPPAFISRTHRLARDAREYATREEPAFVGDNQVPAELRMFSKRLREERSVRGITQTELARQLGMDLSYLSEIERGLANPSVGVMARIASAIGLDLCDMICITSGHARASLAASAAASVAH